MPFFLYLYECKSGSEGGLLDQQISSLAEHEGLLKDRSISSSWPAVRVACQFRSQRHLAQLGYLRLASAGPRLMGRAGKSLGGFREQSSLTFPSAGNQPMGRTNSVSSHAPQDSPTSTSAEREELQECATISNTSHRFAANPCANLCYPLKGSYLVCCYRPKW